MRSLKASLVAGIFSLSLLGLSSCADNDVGVRCELADWDPGSDETATQIDLQALSCESRICVAYRGARTQVNGVYTGPRCTRTCDSDDDCPQDPVSGCNRFVCRIGQSVGGISCCKICVCDDDASATDPEEEACSDKAPKCPNI